ncbi:papain family cysteine protease (macronuclear) [Tetrahymena thermophila SB210]|uniref:Papain family cysteine protease n=1 Tax=Tetrahymena thermophila (strain SB210) TaxID=312017 RepID=Q23RT7_TETTS|nr:papain family cysteine protease [Tetrahymena thermophila SB210]EAR99302.3 papain family cysteine protease [Tetrahymena thermophila SB210]|eukprot:XP_001019547.3 papain family cysteine protease [Tetrahymena thermophila SB210]
MRKLVLLFALIVLATAAPKWNQLVNYTFDDYVKDFNKAYTKFSAEYNQRKRIFEQKLKEIKAFNSNSENGYKKGINQFTDRTAEELRETTLGYSKTVKNAANKQNMFRNLKTSDKINVKDLPKSVDWRDAGVVTPVKDQGHCGSCWAFATTAVIESYAAIATGQLKTLSTQQLVSCVQNSYQCGGQGGCNGAVSELAYNYVQLFGLTSEYKYSYSSYQGQTGNCTFDPTQQPIEVTIDGYLKVPENDYASLMNAVATQGPLVISVDASNFHDYESGVFHGCDGADNVDINHAVVLVGYGTDEKEGDYWIVRNSWGTRFGENGYIRVKREATPTCKTDFTPLDGNGCVGFAKPQKVCGQCGILSDSAYPLNVKVVG